MTATLTTELTTPIGKTSFVNFDDVDPITAREIRHSVENFYRDFPKVAPTLRSVNLEASTFVDAPTAYMSTQSTRRDMLSAPYTISLNPTLYGKGTRRELLTTAHEDYGKRWHGFPCPGGSFEHELGHVVDMWVGARNRLGNGASAAAFTAGYWRPADGATISGYAMAGGPMEAFAEAFANVREGRAAGNATVTRLVEIITAAAQ